MAEDWVRKSELSSEQRRYIYIHDMLRDVIAIARPDIVHNQQLFKLRLQHELKDLEEQLADLRPNLN